MKKRYILCIAAVGLSILLPVVSDSAWHNIDRTEPAPPLVPEPQFEKEPEANPDPDPLLYDVGIFGPDDLRREYVSGEMLLKVPKMKFEGPVYSGIEEITPGSSSYQSVSDGSLALGIALFGAAQVPTDSNSNVSIAGHRDIYGKEFYDIHKLAEGDYMYLEFRGKEYVYLFEDSFVTHDNDWEPIRTKDYGCITLQSCTPIYIASHRIFVVGRLVEIKTVP